MVPIPGFVKLTATIKPGSIYLFQQTKFSSDKLHFHVILNNRPIECSELILVNATSQVEKRLNFVKSRPIPLETLVIVDPSECSVLKQKTAFDCNSPSIYTPQELIERCDSGEFRVMGKISDNLLNKLRNGVISSPLVKQSIKDILLG